jgi:hypothetical protein
MFVASVRYGTVLSENVSIPDAGYTSAKSVNDGIIIIQQAKYLVHLGLSGSRVWWPERF